ncbi:MAG: glycosyltransferase family 4 protein [Gemmatimonadota bacterium]|nr:glycosyltransferase family 4 protein [Gemmatimonadota bacterium]
MERANLALAEYLQEEKIPLHLVAHEVDPEMASRPGVSVHRVPLPRGSFLLGEPLLDRKGRAVARAVTTRWPGARVLVNGGNCAWDDLNWVHCVHQAWPCADRGAPAWFRVKNRVMKEMARRRERRIVPLARMIIANSEQTRRQLVECLGVHPERIRTVYLGNDFTAEQMGIERRALARVWLKKPADRPLVAYLGALGHDRNKGFDTLLAAWRRLCADPTWDADLLAAGGGRGVPSWEREIAASHLSDRVCMLGFTDRVSDLLAAADLLVSPARYDAYGLNVHEAICHGIPALVSGRAGVSERFPPELKAMILPDPTDVEDLAGRLRAWRTEMERWRARFGPLAAELRIFTWRAAAAAIVSAAFESPEGIAAADVTVLPR